MPATRCQPGCTCGLHRSTPKTQEHKDRIRDGIKRAQWDNRQSGRAINQHPVRTAP